jgi:hypothetical protein
MEEERQAWEDYYDAVDASALLGERAGDEWISRKITTNGVISVAWQEISCGKHRAGRRVDIHLQGPTLQIWDAMSSSRRSCGRTRRRSGRSTPRRRDDRATMTDEV